VKVKDVPSTLLINRLEKFSTVVQCRNAMHSLRLNAGNTLNMKNIMPTYGLKKCLKFLP